MGAGEITDEQLVARTVRGDVAAFELLYDRYAPTVMGLALRVVADRALAEEVVQETFWRVWRNAASFQGQRGAFAGWLLGITRNLAIDFCRRRSVRPQVLLDDAKRRGISGVVDVHNRLVRGEFAQELVLWPMSSNQRFCGNPGAGTRAQ